MAVLIPIYNDDLQKPNICKMLCNRLDKPVRVLKGETRKYGYLEQIRKTEINNVQIKQSKPTTKFKSLIPIACHNLNIMKKQPPKSKSHYTQSLIPLMVKSKKELEQSYNNYMIESNKFKQNIKYTANYPIEINLKFIETCRNWKPLISNRKLCDVTKFSVVQENVKLFQQLFSKNSTIIFDTKQIAKTPLLLRLPVINVNFNRQFSLLAKYSQNTNNEIESVLICSISTKTENSHISIKSSISSSSLNTSVYENLDQLNNIITHIDSTCTEAESFVEGRNYYTNFMSDFEKKAKTSDCIVEVFSEQMKVKTLCGLIDNIFGGLLDEFEDYRKAFLLNNESSFPRFDWMLEENLHSIEYNLEPPPIILSIRRIGPWSILVRWNMPRNKNIVGYEICINGRIKSRVLSAERKRAILDSLDLKSINNISIYAMTIFGRCNPPAMATYNML